MFLFLNIENPTQSHISFDFRYDDLPCFGQLENARPIENARLDLKMPDFSTHARIELACIAYVFSEAARAASWNGIVQHAYRSRRISERDGAKECTHRIYVATHPRYTGGHTALAKQE